MRKHRSGRIDGHAAQDGRPIQGISLLQGRQLLRTHLCYLLEHRESEPNALYGKQAGERVRFPAEVAFNAVADRVDPGGECRGPRQRHGVARIPHGQRGIDPPVVDAVLLSNRVGQDRDGGNLAAGSGCRADQHDGQRRMVPLCGIEDLFRHPGIRRENTDGLRRVQWRAAPDSKHEFRTRFMGQSAPFLTGGKGRVRFNPGIMREGDPL